ncbi:MAG: radical SAM protein [Candidatus Pacebacteria bacterium]|nr:radical SAM protein [Candidatus Paceibacterota bacterium]
MYPVLKNCRIRGNVGDFYLQNLKNGYIFKLEDLQAKILWYCNGKNDISLISKKFYQSKRNLLSFFQFFKNENLLDLSKKQINNIVFPLPLKNPQLKEVQIEITGKCNLWCLHCYGRSDFKKTARNELTTKELEELFNQLQELNIERCFLSGGESFTRKDLPILIKQLAKRHIYIGGIFTNGTIYREDVIKAIKKTGQDIVFLVSLDGHSSTTHNFLRGKGNFEKTISFIKKVKKLGFWVTINTIVTKRNVNYLMEMYKFLECLGINRWRVSIPREQGECIKNKEIVMPNNEDFFNAYKDLLKYHVENKTKMKIQLSSIFKTEFIKNKCYYLYQNTNSCCEYKRWSLTIQSNGNVIS